MTMYFGFDSKRSNDDVKHVVFMLEGFPSRESLPALEVGKSFSLGTRRKNALIKVMLNVFEITVEFILSFRLDQKEVGAQIGPQIKSL